MNSRVPRRTSVLLQRLTRALARHLPAAVAGDEKGVHQARVTSRRLREAVPVLATGLAGSKAGKARRKIRRLTGALGIVRELDVSLLILDELAQSDRVSRTAVEDVRTHVIAERDARRAEMLEALRHVDLEKLVRRLTSVGTALNLAVTEPWRKALGVRLLTRSRRLMAAVDAAGQMYDPERLHAVRIAAKKLRYGLELAADSGLKPAAGLVRRIKRTQDMLGRLHDLQVLRTHVAAVQADSHAGRTARREALDNLAQHIEEQCRHLHGRYVASVPPLRELPASIRKIIVPQLAQGGRRSRSVKMVKMTVKKKTPAARPAAARAVAGGR
jgi:CHAD domain-containing protein